jgi:hypothetical protein
LVPHPPVGGGSRAGQSGCVVGVNPDAEPFDEALFLAHEIALPLDASVGVSDHPNRINVDHFLWPHPSYEGTTTAAPVRFCNSSGATAPPLTVATGAIRDIRRA